MLYAYPILSSAGLGNKLFRWARAIVFCHETGAKMIAPRWVDLIKIGPWLRGDRHKRFYGKQFTNAGYVKGLKRLSVLATTARVNEHDRQIDSGVVAFEGMKGFFAPFLKRQPLVKEELWRIVNGPIKEDVEKIAKQGKFVAVHVRLGDFTHLGCAASQEWYVKAIKRALDVQEAVGHKFLRVFSDGYPEELAFVAKAFPDENVVVMPKTPAIQDILAMSKASVLIGSPGSTFSMWAVFLGQMPSIWRRDNMPSRLYNGQDKVLYVD